jgi:L-amino acid N-acyltransferase YncA
MEKLDSDILTNDTHYFFSSLTDRFTETTYRWAQKLSAKFHKSFKPIFLLPYQHNSAFEEENYIVLNERLFQTQERLKKDDLIDFLYPEDMNKQFSISPRILELIEQLFAKQGIVYILPFTSVWLSIASNPKVKLLSPAPDVAALFDDKVEHIRIFQQLGIPANKTEIFMTFEEARTKQKMYPFFFSVAFSSGGFESCVIRDPAHLEGFYKSLRPVNQKGPFIAARLLTDIVLAPNVNAMVVGQNQTCIVCISDQLLRENNYMGNIYPSSATPLHQKLMTEATQKIGNYMSSMGFRGMFGVDFLISRDGSCFPTDINPRRQGGYFCNVMMSKKIDLIDRELSLYLGEPVTPFSLKDMQIDYSWAHHKLAPYYHNVEINEELIEGHPKDPFEHIGSVYTAMYYPKHLILLSGNPGFYAASGYDKNQLKQMITTNVDRLLNTLYKRRPDIDELIAPPTVHNAPLTNIIIEPFHTNDLEAVEQILTDHVKDPTGIAWEEIHDIERYMKGEKDPDGRKYRYLIAHDAAGTVLGCIGYTVPAQQQLIKFTQSAEKSCGEIVHTFVTRHCYHGGGVGKQLFEKACDALRHDDKTVALMDSGIRYKDSWKFFDQIGCEPVGIIPDKYGPGWHAKAWKKNL